MNNYHKKENLIQIEKELIKFLSKKRGSSYKEVENLYLETKQRFNFQSDVYRKYCCDSHDLMRLLFNDTRERGLIDTYSFHSFIHLLRMVSYLFPKPKPGKFDYLKGKFGSLKLLMGVLQRGEYYKLLDYVKKRIAFRKDDFFHKRSRQEIAKLILAKIKSDPRVIDYGCGLGYLSFEIARQQKKAKIYLVDVECLTLEFARFRFMENGFNVKIIPVTKKDLYPKLPKHNICIATEVMEHLIKPIVVYKNIYNSLEKGGILYGGFEDHRAEVLHVSTNLDALRKLIERNFKQIGYKCSQKI